MNDECKSCGQLRAKIAAVQLLIDEQAADDALWFVARFGTEAYLQLELRRLHAAIEAIS